MIFKSIRWRLQIWYGMILVLVLAGFGFTAYQLEGGRQLRRTDEELRLRVGELMRVLRSNGPRDSERPSGSGRRPPPDRPFDGEERGFGPPPTPPGFSSSPEIAKLFETGEERAFYYVLWRRDGREISRSASAPAHTVIPDHPASGTPELVRARGTVREAFRFTPLGECLLAGRSIAPDIREQRRLAGWLTAVGGVVLLLGLAGGWWIATRAIRPVEEISATAAKIAAGDLSQRINTADTDDELGRLAGVLNATFARLDAAFAQQGRFTSDAAHELRTPVTVMLTQTQTALHRERSAEEYRQTIESCQRAAQRMRRLIESLLELARFDAGQEPMKHLMFDLSNTTRDCVELVRPLAVERGVAMHCDLPALACVGDSERIAQVITNLLTNAIQYNKDKGEVRVTTEQKNGTTLLTVADSGQGILADDLPRVFERFYRADKARSGTLGHTGLGLAISKAIVEAHSGTLEVSSPPGGGATFVLRLPTESRPSPQRPENGG